MMGYCSPHWREHEEKLYLDLKSPLIVASCKNTKEIVKWLVDAGFSLDMPGGYDKTALMHAVESC
jgi:ankyrin repeat protein